MDLEKIEKLVNIIEKSSMLEFSIQEGDTKIKMSRRGSAGAPGEPLTVVKTEMPAEETVDEHYIISPIVGTFYSAVGLRRSADVSENIDRKPRRNCRQDHPRLPEHGNPQCSGLFKGR